MRNLFKDVHNLSKLDKHGTLPLALCKLAEEFGELAQVVNMKTGRKKNSYSHKEIRSKVAEESADVIQNVFCVADKFGITYEEILICLAIKNIKWENNISERKNKKRK